MTFSINNPLGNGGYGFAQPIDLTSGVAAIAKSEIAQKLRDKEINRQNLRQDEQWILTQMPEQVDAMRMKMAGTLSKEMEGFRKLQTDVMAAAKGNMNEIPIEQKMKIANEMRRINAVVGDEKTFISQYQAMAPKYAEFRKTLKTKEDISDFDKRLSDLQGKIANPDYKATGLDLIDPMTPPEPTPSKSIDDFMKDINGLYNRSAYKTTSDKQGTIQLIADRMKFDPNIARIVNTSYSGIDSDDKQAAAEALYNTHKDIFTKQEDVKQPRGLSGSGGDLSKKTNLTLTPVSLGGVKKNVLNFPQQMSRVEKKYTIGDAIDPETGKTIPINKEVSLNNMSIIEDDGVIRAEIAGGEVKRKGEPLLYEEAAASAMDGQPIATKERSGKTVSEIKKNAFALLKGKSKDATWDAVKDVDVTQNEDGTYSLKGTLTYTPAKLNIFNKPKEVQVETKLTTLTDDKEKKVVYLPISQYRNMVEGMSKQYKVGDKSFSDYLDEIENGKAQSSPQENTPNEVQRTTKDGKTAIFDATTKKFIRYAN